MSTIPRVVATVLAVAAFFGLCLAAAAGVVVVQVAILVAAVLAVTFAAWEVFGG